MMIDDAFWCVFLHQQKERIKAARCELSRMPPDCMSPTLYNCASHGLADMLRQADSEIKACETRLELTRSLIHHSDP
jgi:hypothetical protein